MPTTVGLLCAHPVRDIPWWFREEGHVNVFPESPCDQVIAWLCRAHKPVPDSTSIECMQAASPLSLRQSQNRHRYAPKSGFWIGDSSKVGENRAMPTASLRIAGNKDLGSEDKLLGSHTLLSPFFQTFIYEMSISVVFKTVMPSASCHLEGPKSLFL